MRRALWSIVLGITACGGEGSARDATVIDRGEPGPDGAEGEGSWSPAPPLAGGPRQETGVAALGGLVYVVGGFDDGLAVVPEVETYDPSSETWSSATDLPAAMHHANVAAVGDKLYVVGSLRALSFTANGEVWEHDPAGGWTLRTAMPAGTERGASGVAAIGSKIYVAGGSRDGGAVDDFSAYDTATHTWEALPPLPVARDHLVAGAIGGRVVAVGGRGGQIGGHTTRVDLFDPTTNAWSAGAPMPTSRGGSAAAVVGGRLYVFGGEGSNMDPSGVFDETESYDPVTDTWATHAPMLTPRHGTGAAAVDGRIFVPGGADAQAFAAVATVEVFTP